MQGRLWTISGATDYLRDGSHKAGEHYPLKFGFTLIRMCVGLLMCVCMHVTVCVYPPFSVSFMCARYCAKDILDIISAATIPYLQTRNLSLREFVSLV